MPNFAKYSKTNIFNQKREEFKVNAAALKVTYSEGIDGNLCRPNNVFQVAQTFKVSNVNLVIKAV